jgi:CTP:molybdopterin cytidylyltransferase MocA
VDYRNPVITRIAGILLAAGDGTRLGQPKATVELAGATLAERGVRLLRDGGADPVVVVTGAVPVELADTLAVHNPDWLSGMGSSLVTGLRALSGGAAADTTGGDSEQADAAAAVIALADQPLIGPEAVRRLIAAYHDGATVAVAAYDGMPRNPVLIAAVHWPEVISMAAGDTGARPFLRAHPDLVTLIECGDVGRPDDIDTPEDLARVRAGLDAGDLLCLDAPADGDGLPGLQDDQVLAADERVRRAGHRLDGDRRAAALRFERVTGEDLEPRVGGIHPHGRRQLAARQPDPGEAVGFPAQPGERMVELDAGELARKTQVVATSGHVLRRAAGDEPVIDRLPAVGGQGKLAVVDRRGARGQVRVRTSAPRGGAAPLIRRGHRDMQPGLGVEAVRDVDLDGERIALLTMRGAAQRHLAAVMRDPCPGHEPGQAVDGVPESRLREGELVALAVERVAAPVDPVGPWGQQLAGAVWRKFVGVEAGHQRGAAKPEAAQTSAKLGDGRPVVACFDLVLGARERDGHVD